MNPMAEQVGPDFYDERSLAEVLGSAEEPLATADVKAMREGKDVLALPTADGHWVFPTWQVADGAILPGIPDVLAAFASAPVWSVGLWLTTSDERWGGRTPVEALGAGETAAVVEEAAATAARWA
ncbi:hypothetical protein GCM10007231_21850 [Nocardioides daphniae]|nr:hypothetical protein GCM10007231_21850 [Nocardioides daphniae]